MPRPQSSARRRFGRLPPEARVLEHKLERQARRLRVASSSAARTRIRCSSVITCHRVARRSPVCRTRPAIFSSRSIASTRSRFAFARAASSEVVSPPAPDTSDSSRSAATAPEAGLAFGREVRRPAPRDRATGPDEAGTEVPRRGSPGVRVRRLESDANAGGLVSPRVASLSTRPFGASSAVRAAFNVLISWRISSSRVSIESTLSWVVLLPRCDEAGRRRFARPCSPQCASGARRSGRDQGRRHQDGLDGYGGG